jgi:translation initiation factor IF-2
LAWPSSRASASTSSCSAGRLGAAGGAADRPAGASGPGRHPRRCRHVPRGDLGRHGPTRPGRRRRCANRRHHRRRGPAAPRAAGRRCRGLPPRGAARPRRRAGSDCPARGRVGGTLAHGGHQRAPHLHVPRGRGSLDGAGLGRGRGRARHRHRGRARHGPAGGAGPRAGRRGGARRRGGRRSPVGDRRRTHPRPAGPRARRRPAARPRFPGRSGHPVPARDPGVGGRPPRQPHRAGPRRDRVEGPVGAHDADRVPRGRGARGRGNAAAVTGPRRVRGRVRGGDDRAGGRRGRRAGAGGDPGGAGARAGGRGGGPRDGRGSVLGAADRR